MSQNVDLHDDTRKYNTVGWQADGLFRVTTQLVAGPSSLPEREIDIDDREAHLLVTLEMASTANFQWKATKLELDLVVDNKGDNANIAIDGVTNGVVNLITAAQDREIFPGGALYVTVKVETGAFSSPQLQNQSAKPGTKNFPMKLRYVLEPLVGPPRQTSTGHLIFFVASD